jgi:hypothetical protein
MPRACAPSSAAVFARITGTRQQGEHIMDIIAQRSVPSPMASLASPSSRHCLSASVSSSPACRERDFVAGRVHARHRPGAVIIVVLPAIIWAFSAMGTTGAIIFTVWSLLAGLSDAVLKPMLIGHGLEVPMPVILLGVIGGVMAYGLIGLFFGAVILAVGYVLFYEWLGEPAKRGVSLRPRSKPLRFGKIVARRRGFSRMAGTPLH